MNLNLTYKETIDHLDRYSTDPLVHRLLAMILEKEEKIVQEVPKRIVKEIQTIKLEEIKSKGKQKKSRKILKRSLLTFFVLLALVGGYVGFKFFHSIGSFYFVQRGTAKGRVTFPWNIFPSREFGTCVASWLTCTCL